MSVVEFMNSNDAEALIVAGARVCYDSGDKSSPESDSHLIRACVRNGHHSVLEHGTATYYIRCSRVVSHELVRHRLASYSQRSQRYVSEDGAEFHNPIEDFDNAPLPIQYAWNYAITTAKVAYKALLEAGVSKQIARYVLPNATMTDIIVTANLREWRHICELRTSKKAQPEMREVATAILTDLKKRFPDVFFDL